MSDAIAAGSQFGTFEKQDKILVALSGGVDSSVTLQILRDQGLTFRQSLSAFLRRMIKP